MCVKREGDGRKVKQLEEQAKIHAHQAGEAHPHMLPTVATVHETPGEPTDRRQQT
mgnify:CR=1 FL=1